MSRIPTRPLLMAMLALGFAVAGLAQAGDAGEVPDSPRGIRPLLIGATIPQVTVKDAKGADLALADVFRKEPTILIVYRGGW
jgi:hypothetical protein